jgi:hypothetical protein
MTDAEPTPDDAMIAAICTEFGIDRRNIRTVVVHATNDFSARPLAGSAEFGLPPAHTGLLTFIYESGHIRRFRSVVGHGPAVDMQPVLDDQGNVVGAAPQFLGDWEEV